MKKVVLFIICFFSVISFSNAFFGSSESLDLYKNIDSWIEELWDHMIEYEINWWPENDWVIEEIHFLAYLDAKPLCLDKSKIISNSDFKKIVENQDVKTLFSYMNRYCDTNELLNYYLILFNTHYKKSKYQADKKSEKIYKIWNIGIFSDGILENSGFDLIDDMKEIDKVIFASKNDYNWDEWLDLWESITELTEKINNDMVELANKPIQIIELNELMNNTTIQENNNSNYNIEDTQNNYSCPENTENSNLSSNSVDNILNDIEENLSNSGNINNNTGSLTQNKKESKPTIVKEWDYTKITDNSMFPCNTFFCITVEFIMYNHSLFWGWENITIEYLLNRSNKHLRKFAWTSLIPAKMTIWNFELWLEDLNLPDIFHLGFQISKKPIPILNIEKQNKKDETEFSANNMLKKYYEANWLDYKRRNDLVLLKSLEQEKQSVLNSDYLYNETIYNNQMNYYTYKLKNKRQNNSYFAKAVEKKVSYWVLQDFEEQFIELSRFTEWINDYVNNMSVIIKNMNEIPIRN